MIVLCRTQLYSWYIKSVTTGLVAWNQGLYLSIITILVCDYKKITQDQLEDDYVTNVKFIFKTKRKLNLLKVSYVTQTLET